MRKARPRTWVALRQALATRKSCPLDLAIGNGPGVARSGTYDYAYSCDMPVERAPGPSGASFSSAVVISGGGRLVYVSGQLAPGGDLEAQTRGCFDRIDAVLSEAGASLRDVVSIRAYLTSLDDYPVYARVRAERFRDALPASAAVQVAGLLDDALVEIEAVAYIER